MSIIERLPEVEQSLREAVTKKREYEEAMESRRQQNAQHLVEEVETSVKALDERVGLNQIFGELKTHLSSKNFIVEIEETTDLQPEDRYYGLFSYTHQWTFRWSKLRQPYSNSFVIIMTKNSPFFTLRISGGGTGEATTDFDLDLGMENIDQKDFRDAVAKAFLRPIRETKRGKPAF